MKKIALGISLVALSASAAGGAGANDQPYHGASAAQSRATGANHAARTRA